MIVAQPCGTKTIPTSSRHSSESNEHYTPALIVEAARQALGGIDLDPASCEEANAWIKASTIFTREYDGFTKTWCGLVFLNPPGGLSDNQQRPVKPKCRETGACGLPVGHTHEGVESSQKKWWFKLANEFDSGRVTAAIFVCFSVELLQTSQVDRPGGLPIPLNFPLCFPKRRISYVKPGGAAGTAPPHASAIIYLGAQRDKFAESFAHIGHTIGT